jgi:CHAD domain-containing protein
LAGGGDDDDDDDEELHKARKAGKRARYAVELASSVVGGKVKKRIKRYEELQDILGDYQDGVVAAALLRRLATATAQHGNENGFTYGLLYAHEQHRAEHSRQLARGWTP